MRVLLDDPALVDDLCAHFRRSGFTADPDGGGIVELSLTEAPSREQERNEILVHLQLWRILNPGGVAKELHRQQSMVISFEKLFYLAGILFLLALPLVFFLKMPEHAEKIDVHVEM